MLRFSASKHPTIRPLVDFVARVGSSPTFTATSEWDGHFSDMTGLEMLDFLKNVREQAGEVVKASSPIPFEGPYSASAEYGEVVCATGARAGRKDVQITYWATDRCGTGLSLYVVVPRLGGGVYQEPRYSLFYGKPDNPLGDVSGLYDEVVPLFEAGDDVGVFDWLAKTYSALRAGA